MHRVFAYGTLKRGFRNFETAMKGYPCLGRFRTVEAYPLVVGGPRFLPYLIAEPGAGHRVFGEVFEVDERGLRNLDRFEGTHLDKGYRRIAIAIEAADRPFDAWAYVTERHVIDGIHAGPLEEYRIALP